jgi:hypothetical protein
MAHILSLGPGFGFVGGGGGGGGGGLGLFPSISFTVTLMILVVRVDAISTSCLNLAVLCCPLQLRCSLSIPKTGRSGFYKEMRGCQRTVLRQVSQLSTSRQTPYISYPRPPLRKWRSMSGIRAKRAIFRYGAPFLPLSSPLPSQTLATFIGLTKNWLYFQQLLRRYRLLGSCTVLCGMVLK